MALKQQDVAAIRTSYELGQLSEDEVAADAIAQFQRWFDDALENQVVEPNAMTLSTVSANGRPSSRIVLLKGVSESGFSFFTNYESRKGTELASNPYAALLFFWPELQRQVRIEGRVEQLSPEESEIYFQSRPKGSKLGAVVSPQSREIANRAVLDDQMIELEQLYKDTETVPRPPHWGGYRLLPDLIEFWQGRGSRLHDRLVYKNKDNRWDIVRLAP